jgi:hypothetical protein
MTTKINFNQIKGAIYNVLDYGANTTPGTTNMQAAIQAAINAAETAGGGTVYIPAGTYAIATPLTILGSIALIGEPNTTLYNTSTTTSHLICGASTTVFNDDQTFIEKITFNGLTPAVAAGTCHGVHIKAKQVVFKSCNFSNLGGSGIRGEYSQYTRIYDCGFSTNGRYGMEFSAPDAASECNDMVISGIYQNFNNILGGIYGVFNQSLLQGNTFTCTVQSKTTGAHLDMTGRSNVVDNCTFEMDGVTGKTMVGVVTTGIAPNVISNCTFQTADVNTHRGIYIGTGSLDVITMNNSFNMTGNAGNSGDILKFDAATKLTSSNDIFSGWDINPSSSTVGIGCTGGLYNIIFDNILKNRINAQTTTAGAFDYSKSVLKLPCFGVWELTVISGGIADTYATQRGVNVATVYWFPSMNSTYPATPAAATVQVLGTQTVTAVVSLTSAGLVNVIATNTVAGTMSFTVYASQRASTE